MRAGRLGAGLAGVLAYAACVLALAPATLVDAGLQRASDGRVRLAEARGTLWTGSGQIEIRDAGGSAGLGNSLSWQFEPRALLRGALRFELDLGAALKRFPVTISRSGIDIGEAQFVVPAAVLGLAVRRLALLKPTGDLVVRTSALSLRAGALSGNALVQWHAAGSPLSPVSPLGDYELRVALDAGAFDAELRTLSGPLQLEGKAAAGTHASPIFHATALVDAQHEQQLAPFLRLIAIERGAGRFELQLAQALSDRSVR